MANAPSAVPEELVVAVPAGTVICPPGKNSPYLYLIQDGHVAETSAAPGVGPARELGAGQFFGTESLLLERPLASTFTARTACRLVRVDAPQLFELLERNPEIAIRLARALAQRIVELEELPARAPLPLPPVPAVPPAPPITTAAPSPPAAAAAPDEPMLLHAESGTRFPLVAAEIVVGRRDPATGKTPDIDLEVLDQRHSCSRRHAKLLVRDGQVYVLEERATANGTFHNGARLETGNAVLVHAGDTLRFGLVDLRYLAPERG